MNRLFIFILFSLSLTIIANGDLYGQSEIEFSYNTPHNHNAQIYQNDQKLVEIMPGKTDTIKVTNGSHTFDVKIIDANTQKIFMTRSYVLDNVLNSRVAVRIDVNIMLYIKFSVIKTEPMPGFPKSNSPLLKTFGGSIGTSFATPALIGTIHGTFASVKNLYFELGFDFGLLGSYNSTVRRYISLFCTALAELAVLRASI